MWYTDMDRSRPYLRSYRTANLYFDNYHKKAAQSFTEPTSVQFIKRMSKGMSQYRMTNFLLGLTFWGAVKGLQKINSHTVVHEVDEVGIEQYRRLNYHFKKNKFGFSTQIFGDFDMILEAVLNERFFNEALEYQNDEFRAQEITDNEGGLLGEMALSDIVEINKDTHEHGSGPPMSLRFPGRRMNNYPKTDDLSIYKIKTKD